MAGIQEVVEAHRDLAQKQLEIQQESIKQNLSRKQQECLQLFRLTKSTENATYEWFKDRVEDRVQNTCEWFLGHEHFQEWLKQESGPLLVSADPGCGKSVLAKYLIDHILPRSATICYFFFKIQDQNTVCQALCAVLHQLFSQKLSLIHHAEKQFEINGRGMIQSKHSLWNILENAVQDSQAGPVIVVLDALDECANSEFEDLMRNVRNQFRSNQSVYSKLKYLLTSRPYEQIVLEFRGLLDTFPRIRIPGEKESDTIIKEINSVISHRVERLAKEKALSDQVRDHLLSRLLGMQHRTYLWVYLVFDHLRQENFKKTPKGVDLTISTLPMSINEAYEQILEKSKDSEMTRKAFCIILAAKQPLTLTEMNVAMNIDNDLQSVRDLDLEKEKDFESRLRSWCGLFVSTHHGKVYFLHQTAQEYLLFNSASRTTICTLRWHHSITIEHAHRVLAELCVRYLNILNYDASLDTRNRALYIKGRRYKVHSKKLLESYTFLDYSARCWSLHFRQACVGVDEATIIRFALEISDPKSNAYTAWVHIYAWSLDALFFENPTPLHLASYFGHAAVAKLLVNQGADLESRDPEHGGTPLSWASEKGHEVLVKLLLENGAKIEFKNIDTRTPLSLAAANGHERVVKMLLENGAEIESKDDKGVTPLSLAAAKGHQTVVKLLLKNSANLGSKDQSGRTPLLEAAANGHGEVAKVLLETGADLGSKDTHDPNPLIYAAARGHVTVVALLLENGADLDTKDELGRTPLFYAAAGRHELVARFLLKKGAYIDTIDEHGESPVSRAFRSGYKVIVMLLVAGGAKTPVDISKIDSIARLNYQCDEDHYHGPQNIFVEILPLISSDLETDDDYVPCRRRTTRKSKPRARRVGDILPDAPRSDELVRRQSGRVSDAQGSGRRDQDHRAIIKATRKSQHQDD